jgi:ribonuclease R
VARSITPHQGLPSRKQVLDFIAQSAEPAGKREIARAFGLKGQEKIALKALLKDMAEEGLIDGKRTAFHRVGGLPRVTVLRVVSIEDGEAIAVPDAWAPDDATKPPRLRLVEKGRGSALKAGDRVLARTEETGSGWRAYPMKKLPARAEQLLGVVEIDGAGKGWLASVDKRERHSQPIADLGGAERGQLVLAEPAGRSPRSGVKVTEVLGDPLAPRAFSLIAIHKHGIPFAFAEEAVAEAQLAAKLPLSEDKREDLRHLPIVAIDPSDARDHDDAIWAEPDGAGGFRALVAIADVSFYVRPGGALDREARKRGNSVYFPDRVVPMLPEVLSNGWCSLKPREERSTIAVRFRLDKEGNKLDHRFTRGLMRSAARLTYTRVQSARDGMPDEETSELVESVIAPLYGAWAALLAARERRGALELDLPERKVVLSPEGKVEGVAPRERLDSHRLIEDLMIQANVCAAEELERVRQPCMYRVHDTPSLEKLEALRSFLEGLDMSLPKGQIPRPAQFNRILAAVKGSPNEALVNEVILRSQAQAVYAPENLGHFGLGLARYAHFTSPIRRYADLLVHRALVTGLKLGPGGLPAGAMDAFPESGEHISMTERRAATAEREAVDRYVTAFLADRVGATFSARISGVARFGLFVQLSETGADGLLPASALPDDSYFHDEAHHCLVGKRTRKTFQLGQTLDVVLAEANTVTGGMVFQLASEQGGGGRSGRPTGRDRMGQRRPAKKPGRRGFGR